MLTVHHLGTSQSERIVWLLEELDLPYEVIRYERDPVTRLAPPEYRALHPFGTAPVLDDGPRRLAESGAIIEYLIHVHGEGRLAVAPHAPHYADYLFWWHFANASMMPAAMGDGLVKRQGGGADPISRLSSERLDRAYAMADDRLGKVPYFAGAELTAADIVMLFPLTTMRRFNPRDISGCTHIGSYLDRIGNRPAFQRAMSKAEPKNAGATPDAL
jgi:glutathione S-transferase